MRNYHQIGEKRNGFKFTSLGWIPEEWQVKRLSEIVIKPIVYGIVQAGPEVDNGMPYIKSTDVGGEINISSLSKTSHFIASKYKRSQVSPGDIVFSLRGNIGELSVVPINLSAANLTQGTARISVCESFNKAFIKHAIKSPFVIKRIMRQAKGSTFKEISLEQLRKLEIPIPNFEEHSKIGTILCSWDSAILQLDQLLQLHILRKKGLMQKLLTGKKRLPGFSGDWKEIDYQKLLKIVKRPVQWDDDDLYHLISVRRRSGGIFERESLFGHQIKVKDLRTANEGDFLFSKMQIVHGASALVTKKFAGSMISGSYIAVVAKDASLLNMEFFNWYSKTPYFYHQTYISSYGVHIEKMTFDFESFLSLGMKLPSFEEQIAITAVLQTAENEIQLLHKKLDALKDQKKGLVQQLLTGKKRVINKLI
jgi:type I restriction enzyme S subunit